MLKKIKNKLTQNKTNKKQKQGPYNRNIIIASNGASIRSMKRNIVKKHFGSNKISACWHNSQILTAKKMDKIEKTGTLHLSRYLSILKATTKLKNLSLLTMIKKNRATSNV